MRSGSGADDEWRNAVEVLGSLARVFDQDEFNLEGVFSGVCAAHAGRV
jgi:hypothetical protein